ncbi:MAG: hypothetical protein EA426_01275 [Spirochaetaceae bacterium]|nr:MAG: hypothetical protein EA426_01275 [Spirochaetaceae bacterium]
MVKERIESYLINLSLTYEEVGENIWVINDEDKGLGRVVVFAEESLVWFRTKVMEIPKNNKLEFFEQLLKLNAEMVHGAYAIEEDSVILVDSLEYNTLDFEEFQASLDAMGLALAQHYPRLSKYLNN